MKLQKIAKSFYRTTDDRYEISGVYVTAREARGYGAGMRWTWSKTDGLPDDTFDTFREAKASLRGVLCREV